MVAMQRKALETKLSAGEGERAIVARISTTSVDRDGDVILPSGLDSKNFEKNPVVLMMHNNQKLPLGRAMGIERQPDAVIAKAQMERRPPTLPPGIEWPPDTVLDLFKQGAPLGFSVGFRIKDSGARAATVKDRRRFGDGVQRVITQWELLEFSVVPIPSNQDSLLMAVSKCAGPVGSFTKGALGLPSPAKTVIVPRAPKRLRIDGAERLRI
jgi:phage head maturation protease